MKRQIGWIPNAELASRYGITPLDDDWFVSLEQAEDEGGITTELIGYMIPVWVEE